MDIDQEASFVICDVLDRLSKYKETLEQIAENKINHGYGYTGCGCSKVAIEALDNVGKSVVSTRQEKTNEL